MLLVRRLGRLVRLVFIGRSDLVLENLALRQQLAPLSRFDTRPRLTVCDRLFRAGLVETWSEWAAALAIVKPETVIGWHRRGFKLFWRWRSRSRGGRPRIDRVVITRIRCMARENPTWGAPRIRSELALLGHDVAVSTVANYLPSGPNRRRRRGRRFWPTTSGRWCRSTSAWCRRSRSGASPCSSSWPMTGGASSIGR